MSAPPSGRLAQGLRGACAAGLAAYGHKLALRAPSDWQMGSVCLAAWRNGRAIAAADPRREALALAL